MCPIIFPMNTSSFAGSTFTVPSTSLPNDAVQRRGQLQPLHAVERRDAGPVCCDGGFGGSYYFAGRPSAFHFTLAFGSVCNPDGERRSLNDSAFCSVTWHWG